MILQVVFEGVVVFVTDFLGDRFGVREPKPAWLRVMLIFLALGLAALAAVLLVAFLAVLVGFFSGLFRAWGS